MRSRYSLPSSRSVPWAVVASLLLATTVWAQTTFSYNVQPRTLRACRLLLPYSSGAGWAVQASSADADGINGPALVANRSLLFEGLRRYPGKPAGWDFVNPLAAPADSNSLALKCDPAYWEVPLDPTPADAYGVAQLENFDLIYISPGEGVNLDLSRLEWRAALLKAVNAGAVVWVDQQKDLSAATTVNFFAPPGDTTPPDDDNNGVYDAGRCFTLSAGGVAAGSYRRTDNGPFAYYAARDRMLSYPFLLGDASDVQYLGKYPRGSGGSATLDAIGLVHPGWQRVVALIDGGTDYNNIAVTRYGAGAVVVSAGDVGYDVVNWWLGARRNRPVQWEAADCKLAWNIAALAGAFNQSQGGAGAGGAAYTPVAGPLGIAWQYPDRDQPNTTLPLGPVVSSPVEYHGLVFAVSLPYLGSPAQAARLMCFDANPSRDLNGDGNADDGDGAADPDVIDYSVGRSYDLVWKRDLTGYTPRTAGPTATTIVWPASGAHQDVVLVSLVLPTPGNDDGGQVRAYDAHTGAPVFTKTIAPYDDPSGDGYVVDLSTPVVFKEHVFVLASEYNTAADATAGAERAFGRAHAFELNYAWTAGDDNGAKWAYPDDEVDPAHDGDDAERAAGTPDAANPESMRSLPPFQDPYWVAAAGSYTTRPQLPPFPTPRPVLTQPDNLLADDGTNVLLHFSTPVSLKWNSATSQVDLADPAVATDRGGADYVLVPTPERAVTGGTYTETLNQHAFKILLPRATAVAGTDVSAPRVLTRTDNTDITSTCSANCVWQDPVDGRIYAVLRGGQAREALLPGFNSGTRDPLTLGRGATVSLTYETGGVTGIALTADVFGPVRQVTTAPANRRRVASGTLRGGEALSATDTAEADENGTMAATVPGTITARNLEQGTVQWRLRPHRELPESDRAARPQLGKGGLAVDRDSDLAFAAVTAANNPAASSRTLLPQVLALNARPQLRVRLGRVAGAAAVREGAAVTATVNGASVAGWGAVVSTIGVDNNEHAIPASVLDPDTSERTTVYTIDGPGRMLTFNTAIADWVDDTIGELWGKPIWVTYMRTSAANPDDPSADTEVHEVHVLEDLVRGQYTPGVIRLRHNMVRDQGANTFVLTLPNGLPLQASTALNDTALTAPLTDLTGWSGFLLRGFVDVHDVQQLDGEPVLPGTEILVAYEYLDEVTGAAASAVERQQIPLNFGASVAAPILADRTVHVGTVGYLPTAQRATRLWSMTPDPNDPGVVPNDPAVEPEITSDAPVLGFNSVRKSLLSVLFDPITQLVRGVLQQVAIPEPSTYGLSATTTDRGTPVVQGAAALDGGGLLVGSHLMTELSHIPDPPGDPGYQSEGFGFVSRLAPERTLVCDNTRLVEVIGQKPAWVCSGSTAAEYHEGLDPESLDSQEQKVTAFSRPAKALYLDNGNILVADTGNDRVIEIDRQGRQVWPLDRYGYNFYTSDANTILDLKRPSDCFRYYVTRSATGAVTSIRGDLLPPPAGAAAPYTETHTVIADPGNNRVVELITTVTLAGVQSHRVEVVTPATVRLAVGGTVGRLSYTRAQPIFDPLSKAAIGYLCAAANFHQVAVVERGTRIVNPPSSRQPYYGSAGSTWAWLAWLYDDNTADTDYTPDNPLVFRNIRDVQFSRDGATAYLTVTCGQFAGRYATGLTATPHFLAAQGAGVFEYRMNVGGTDPTLWGRVTPADVVVTTDHTVTADDPIWWFTRYEYLWGNPTAAVADRVPRSLSFLNYRDIDGSAQQMELPWNPVAALRLPVDRRPVPLYDNTGTYLREQRQVRHLITNYAEVVQNLSRDNLRDDTRGRTFAPPSLFSSVLTVTSDDLYDSAPENDIHDLDRREVIPDPQDADWSDPFNQPTFADRR